MSEFRAFVLQPDFPCLGARSVVRVDNYDLEVYGALGNKSDARALISDLANFSENAIENRLRAFVAVFPDSPPEGEIEFERRLWRQLQFIHDADLNHGRWASDVSSDPDDPHFSFSVGGRAFFVVGLNPGSSRAARRFHWPTLVFNPHEQFSRLREQGRFDGLRSAIRARDIALQGTENPNLADFGERSEARQYSGRQTEGDWKCPFHPKVP
ncbi:MAG: YqcI/YcgG family protein [Gemmatimonadota bacterium]|nr:YqcI/YcgG family protein [Gemmatimonadota bacterium]